MSAFQHLNGMIARLEAGQPVFSMFAPTNIEVAVELQASPYDGVVFEGEHRGWDINGLRDSLQYLLNRRQVAEHGSLAPAVTPLARIPANGAELNQFLAKQALDIGCYGVVWPHISTVEEAYNAVAACRYPRLKDKPLYEPAGIRGDGPVVAARYWGVSQQEYYERADVWPLAPRGDILAILQIEDMQGIDNLRDILRNVPGIGVILVGEGDLSQELGYPRQTEHPAVLEAIEAVARICNEHGVIVGHPHASAANAPRLMEQGFRFMMCAAPRTFGPITALKEACT
ncbi:4-hydroxy-2-oxoheptanedioate aldolase [Rhizobium azooxidifex]|uniref:4-hydroxy-2-oxoheptanedioate aldolase n=1 Tax=Mycoplana azooxidifex TaxID=1636188 RepID=A0A7W6GJT8_9HYPH|nr:aldolase/citrate lyase family protein [Mycoplana azooxidifex]MBB3977612.1 4-hydroxy-2-oxoheptanedioate aldolase [Mycoplana azooxidifex]